MTTSTAGNLLMHAARCACGQPLHYRDPELRRIVDDLIAVLGPEQAVTTAAGTWWVPRHYTALHGLKADELPELAARLGFRPAPAENT